LIIKKRGKEIKVYFKERLSKIHGVSGRAWKKDWYGNELWSRKIAKC